MNDEQIRIAVAKELGWQVIETDDCNGTDNYWLSKDGQNVWRSEFDWPMGLPHYQDDLNACHEMEKAMLSDEGNDWKEYDTLLTLEMTFPAWFASARDRCEAFLRVRGKWID